MSGTLMRRYSDIIRRTAVRRGELTTVEGYAPLALPDNAEWKAHSVTLYGKSVQDGVPEPDSPVPVIGVEGKLRTRGKNLFDKNKVTKGYYLSETNGSISEALNFSLSEYIKISPNTNYRASGFGASRGVFCLFDINKNFIQSVISHTGQRNIPTTSDSAYLMFSFATSAAETTQLELGNTATPYNPYRALLPNGEDAYIDNIDGTSVMPYIKAEYYKEVSQ